MTRRSGRPAGWRSLPARRTSRHWIAGTRPARVQSLDPSAFEFGLEGGQFLDGANGQHASARNTEGWTGMLVAMKVWLEHGINAREGFYK